MLSLMLMLIPTLMLLIILVDSKIQVNINISRDANLGVRSSLFIANTTADRNCDTDSNRNTSIYTSMEVSNRQLTKYNYNYQYNTMTFPNTSANICMRNSCQYNTKTFTNTSTNTSTKYTIRIYVDTNNEVEKLC